MDIIFKDIVETERLIIKKYDLSFDMAQKMYAIIDKNREHLLPWLDWALPAIISKPEDEYNYLLSCDKSWKAGERFEYGVFEKKSNAFLGGITLMKRGRSIDKTFEIGYWLVKDACGKGYMQEAVKHLEEEAFAAGVIRIIIKNNIDNVRSANVAKKLGYTLEGIERKGRWHEALKAFADTNIFAKVKE